MVIGLKGKFRDGVHVTDVNDLMRRMVKEQLVTFEGKPLFPERCAYTVPYPLSDDEARLYAEVTDYVRTQFNRAENLAEGRKGYCWICIDRIAATTCILTRSDLPVGEASQGTSRKPTT